MMNDEDDRTRSLLDDSDRREVDVDLTLEHVERPRSSSLFAALKNRLGGTSSQQSNSSGASYAAIALDDSPVVEQRKQPVRSEREKAKIRQNALKRQQENNTQFMKNLKKEEDEIMAEIRRRKEQEARDAEIAMRLQFGDDSREGVPRGQLVRVTCPRNRSPGDCVTVSIPRIGLIATRIPSHTRPGQEFSFRFQEHNAVCVQFKVPPRLGPSRRIELTTRETGKYLVTVPPTARSGQTMHVRLMKSSHRPPVAPPPATTLHTQQQIDPSFLAALPPDIREELLRSQGGIAQQVAALTSVSTPAPTPTPTLPTISTKESEKVEEEEEEDVMDDLFSGMNVREEEEEEPKVELTVGTPTSTSAPPLERLRTAKQMLEEGLIDQNEFDELKSEILGDLKN
eukprot:g6039.t1